MTVTSPPPKIVEPGTGKKLAVPGGVITILLSGEDTGGMFALLESGTEPGAGPPLHMHHREDETFAVLEGEFEIQVDKEVVRATPGAVVFAPKGLTHRFQNVSATPGRMLISLTPGGFENFFVEADQIPPEGRRDPERLAAVAKRYELEFMF